jgi:hypothetical protein
VSELECYRILGVKPGATHSELMHAYRVLAKIYHPDSASGNGSSSAFVRIMNAYQSLAGRKSAPHMAGTGARTTVRPKPREAGTDIFALGRTLLFDTSPWARAQAARNLAWTGKKSAYAFLRKAFWDKSEEVRISAIRAVGSLCIRQSAGELASLFSKGSTAAKKEVLAAVARIGAADGFRSIVILGLRDTDAAVRAAARSLSDVPR